MAKDKPTNIVPTQRVLDILRLLDRSPLPAHVVLKASRTFGTAVDPDYGFTNVRRVREKLQQLASGKLITVHEYTLIGHGVINFYQLAPAGYRLLYRTDPPPTHRKFFRPVAKLNWEHTYSNGQVIVHSLVAAAEVGIRVTRFFRENELSFAAGMNAVQPDHFVQFASSGQCFNHAFEIDLNNQTLDSFDAKAWRQRILCYEAYQDRLLATKNHPSHRFRVIFLTTSMEHAYNLLSLAADLAINRDRVLFYATTLDAFVGESHALTSPILLDHFGRWQSLVNVHPTSHFERVPVRLPQQSIVMTGMVC